MDDEQIYCPACNHRLRVPADLLGQPVECPQCRARFTAPVRTDVPAVNRAPRDASDFAPAYADDAEARAYRAPSDRLTAPAVALLIVCGLGCLMNGYVFVNGMLIESNPALFEQQFQAELDKNPQLTPQQRRQLETMFTADVFARWLKMGGGISFVTAVLSVLGAIAMLVRKAYALALLGAIAALNPINCCCLDANLPFAVWALIVLLNADVRAAFK